MRRILNVLVCLQLMFIYCGPSQKNPADILLLYANYLENNEYEKAYQLMGKSYRDNVPFSDFKIYWEKNNKEKDSFVKLLKYPPIEIEQQALLKYGAGDEIKFIWENNRWLINTNISSFYDQSNPRVALRSFIRAVKNKRYDILLNFIPNTQKEGITSEILRNQWEGQDRDELFELIGVLEENIDSPIESVGDRATMRYYNQYEVHFLFEDSRWKIESWN